MKESYSQFFDSKETRYTGKIVFASAQITVIATHQESILFNSQREIVIRAKKLDEGSVDNQVSD